NELDPRLYRIRLAKNRAKRGRLGLLPDSAALLYELDPELSNVARDQANAREHRAERQDRVKVDGNVLLPLAWVGLPEAGPPVTRRIQLGLLDRRASSGNLQTENLHSAESAAITAVCSGFASRRR